MQISRLFHPGAAFIRDQRLVDPGGSADIKYGAALMAGTTTSRSGLVLASGAIADFAGICLEEALSAAFGTVALGTLLKRKVALEPSALYEVECSQAAADLIANDVASATAGSTTFTTDQADDFDGGWKYIVTGTGAGQLRYVTAATTTVFTNGLTDWTTQPDATSDLMMIPSRNTQLLDLRADATMFACQNGSSSAEVGRIHVVELKIKSDAIATTPLEELTHELDGLNTANVRFFLEVFFTNSILHKID